MVRAAVGRQVKQGAVETEEKLRVGWVDAHTVISGRTSGQHKTTQLFLV